MLERRLLKLVFIVKIILSFLCFAASIPEPGIVNNVLPGSPYPACPALKVQKSMFAGSYFRVNVSVDSVKCDSEQAETLSEFNVTVSVWALKCSIPLSSTCELDYDGNPILMDSMYSQPQTFSCSKNFEYVECLGCHWKHNNKTETLANNMTQTSEHGINVYKDGIYHLIITLESWKDINVSVTVESRGSYGYLSAADWPQLPFYRTMIVIYVLYALVWLVLCCCHRSDLLRIQYWIGGVIFIGLIEKAVFLGEYETLNRTGRSVYGAVILGELVSSAKKMLSRILVIIVCVGFGIVKPRLGATLHKVLAVGVVYFITSSIEGCLRATRERVNQDKMAIIANLVLTIIDAAICWWIFSSLIQTMRTLRVRRNVVKLSLYRHFTNTLIFAVLASLGFTIWSYIEHHFVQCVQDWKELWVDEAFWHLLFVIILLVIMVLWRPSANNQRYAYSPLVDIADDEAEEPMINDAFDGIKLRGSKSHENNTNKADAEMEDDLKWVDDNIPASIVDSALPSILDSEEEIVATTYERGKMQ